MVACRNAPPRRAALFLPLVVLVGSACSSAPVEEGAERFDLDPDVAGSIGEAELQETLDAMGFRDSWDLDSDNVIDGEEFGYGFGDLSAYDSWDFDGSGILTPREVRQAVAAFSPVDLSTYRWDRDGDGAVEPEELAPGLRRAWDVDMDEFLSAAELSRGLFHFWDANRNGRLEPEELPPELRSGG